MNEAFVNSFFFHIFVNYPLNNIKHMANKRSLKRGINVICEELFIECVAASLYGTQSHNDNADALLFSIIKMQADYTCRVSHPEPGMSAKMYYRNLRENFAAQVSELVDQINNL